MKFSVVSAQNHPSRSFDSYAFTATVALDGKNRFKVSDYGDGSPVEVHDLNAKSQMYLLGDSPIASDVPVSYDEFLEQFYPMLDTFFQVKSIERKLKSNFLYHVPGVHKKGEYGVISNKNPKYKVLIYLGNTYGKGTFTFASEKKSAVHFFNDVMNLTSVGK